METKRMSDLKIIEKDPYQELLDDPSVPFPLRWKIILEIDRTNKIYLIFVLFLSMWKKHIAPVFSDKNYTYKILEIGPGSGSLGRKICTWMAEHEIKFEYFYSTHKLKC